MSYAKIEENPATSEHRKENKIKFYLFLFITSCLILISGGRLVSSDEVSMYLTVESLVKHGTFDIPAESAVNATIHNGKAYTWYEAGNILAGIPLYIAGRAAAVLLPLSENLKLLLPRTFVSLTNAFIGGLTALMFFSLCRKFGLSLHVALAMTFTLVFSTFLLPYFKLYLREPILTLSIIGGMNYLAPEKDIRFKTRSTLLAGTFVGFGILTKFVFVLNIFPLLIYLYWKNKKELHRTFTETINEMFFFILPIILIGLGGTGIYNLLRFGNIFDMGYTGGRTFPTPLFTGVFGLLVSPGKGLFWFAPILFLLPWALKYFWIRFKNETICIISIFVLNLILYGKYIAWGGDGSWGPRYLTFIVPLLLLIIANYYQNIGKAVKRIAVTLILVGCFVQFGGISIYAGSYLREIGEFPFKRDFNDPEFLSKAHFIPDYSPLIGHWKMLSRNLAFHINGNYPHLQVDTRQFKDRLPISVEDQKKLGQTLDFWFTYGLYAGISSKIIIALVIILTILASVSGIFLLKAFKSFSI
jgi:hypothetical protein